MKLNNIPTFVSDYEMDNSFKEHTKKVFLWLLLGLLITTIVAGICYTSVKNHGFIEDILSNTFVLILIVIFELVCAFLIHKVVYKLNSVLCIILYILYAALTGLTFSILPMAYGIDNIFIAFICTMILFGVCAFMGYVLKIDLTKWAPYVLAALVVLILISVASIFIPVLRDSLIVTIISIIIFSVFTAIDIQFIKKNFVNIKTMHPELLKNFAIYGAFSLYIDFVNLFLDLLRIVSKIRSKG